MSDLIDRERFSADMRDFQNRVGIWRDEAEDTETRTRADAALATIIETKLILDKQPTIAAPRWHRVDEPPKEEGKYFVAYRSSVVDGWCYDTAYYTNHLEDKMLVIPVPENSEGWFNWSDFSDCDMLVFPDYWMPPEPPKEEE